MAASLSLSLSLSHVSTFTWKERMRAHEEGGVDVLEEAFKSTHPKCILLKLPCTHTHTQRSAPNTRRQTSCSLSDIFLLLPPFFLSPLICRAYVPPSGQCFPSLFSFGDSNADTGNAQATFPFESSAERPPYGRTFFGQPSDRYCDERLVIGFQAQAYGLPLLSPYGRGLGSNFRHGANFAASGSACIPNLANSSFYLARQFNQFRKLKSHYMEVQSKDKSYSPPSEYFGGGLYVISTGENDYRAGLIMGLSAKDIKKQLVPRVIEIIYTTVRGLNEEGARKFMVVGIAADGCIPVLLTLVPHKKSQDLDTLGCLLSVNNYVQFHNRMLLEAVKKLRVEFSDANFAYGDYFGANIDILVNSHTHGKLQALAYCNGTSFKGRG